MTIDLEHQLFDFLVSFYRGRVLDHQSRPRRELYVGQKHGKSLIPSGGFLAGSAAFLALTDRPDNPYYGSDHLLQLARDAGERLVLDHADITPETKPNHFQIFPLASAYSLMQHHADKPTLARWRETLHRNLQSVSALIDRVGDNLGHAAPRAGTGPNHYFGWFAVGYQQALVLGENALAQKIQRAMYRHMKIQSPAGYFPERTGPATQYHNVSIGGLAEFHRLHPSSHTLDALHSGLHFLVHAIYPDLHSIETIDERNRRRDKNNLQQALFWSPAGRNLFARVLDLNRKYLKPASAPLAASELHPFAPNELQMIGHAFRCYQHAVATQDVPVAASLPIDQKSFSWNLENKALVRKTGPWFHVLSAYNCDAPQGNPYHLDRTQLISIFHDRAGLIVGGGNDKRAYQAATIDVAEGGECHYFPPTAIQLQVGATPQILGGRALCDALELDYGSAKARLELRVDSPSTLRLAARITTTQTQPEIFLVLQLNLHAPITLLTGGKKLVLKMPADAETSKEYPLAKTLEWHSVPHRRAQKSQPSESPESWRMSLPKGSTLLWPHFPWAPYRPPTHRQTPENAIALVRIPLHTLNWEAEVVVHAPAT